MYTEQPRESRIMVYAGSSVGDERQSYKLEVVGSNPTRRTKRLDKQINFIILWKWVVALRITHPKTCLL